jgi:hypothetical protein
MLVRGEEWPTGGCDDYAPALRLGHWWRRHYAALGVRPSTEVLG